MATKAWREANAEKVRQYRRTWYANHAEAAKAAIRQRQQDLIEWLREVRNGLSCQQCGEADPACLDFHHRDPAEKEVELGRIVKVKGWSKARIMAEIEKCDVLCANCHRKLHHRERAEELGSVM